MAKSRSLTFNITTTADFADLNALKNAINAVSTEVNELTHNMSRFNTAMKNIRSGYEKTADSVKQVTQATTKLTASVKSATQAQTKYDQIVRRQTSLNRQLKAASDSLTKSKRNLIAAEKDLARATQAGDPDDIRQAQRAHEAAKKAFDAEVRSAQKLGVELDKLETQRKEIASELAHGRAGAANIFNSLSKDAQAANGYIKNIIGDFAKLETRSKGTAGTFSRMKTLMADIMRTASYSGKLGIAEDAERTLDVLKQTDAARTQFNRDQIQQAKELAAIEKANEERRVAEIRARRMLEKMTDDEKMRHFARQARAEEEMARDQEAAIRENQRRNEAAAKAMIQNIKQQQQEMQKFQRTVQGVVRTMANAFGRFAGGGANMFAGFSRGLMQLQTRVTTFSKAVTKGMQTAQRAMTQFYNSGWSLITSGYIFQNFGEMLGRRVAQGIQDYLDYERIITRTAIAGQVPEADMQRLGVDQRVNPQYIQEMVFGLQRGTIGGPALAMFDAKELGEALYFYASAVGQPITPDTMDELGPIMSNILQLSAATMTELETATKGVLNIAMEFGVDPRAALEEGPSGVNYRLLEQLPSQLAYLANISTMEVPDVIETFKMVGPMAHILSEESEKAGAGLPEMMALTFLASEIGLRGGNVGRGVNQMLTTMLDPTDKALETASQAFGIAASEEAFRAFFFNSEGELAGGLPGLFEKLVALDDAQLAPLLATLFTTNATRSVVGIAEALKRHSLDEIIDDLTGKEALGFLPAAFKATSETLFTSIQNMENALFQFKVAIIDSVSGPLMQVFDVIARGFFMLTDIVVDNPWIGQLIAGLVTLTAAIAGVVGAMFMAGGSILLMLKAFTIFGGMLGPMILLLSAFTTGLLIILPILALFGGAALYIKNQWEDTDSTFRATVLEWRDALEGLLGGALEDAPEFFGRIFGQINAIVNNSGDRFVQWAMQNRDMFVSLKNAAMDFIQAFGTGALTSFIATITIFVNLLGRARDAFNDFVDAIFGGEQAIDPFRQQIVDTESSVEKLIERLIGMETEALNLAKVVGGVLGAAFGLLVARHFIPSFVTTIALRGAFITTRVALLAFAAASFTVSAAFKALQLTLAGIQFLLGALATMWGVITSAEGASSVATALRTTLSVALSTALGVELTLMSALAVVAGILAAAYLGVMAALAAIIIGTIAYTVATDGLRAGLDAAWQAAVGIAEGFWMIVEPTLKLVAGFVMLVGELLGFIGVSNDVHALGVALGVMLGLLVAAFVALATAITAMAVVAILQFIAGLTIMGAPIYLIIAALYLIGEVLAGFLGFDNVFDMLSSGFSHLGDIITWVGDTAESIFSWIVSQARWLVNEIIGAVNVLPGVNIGTWSGGDAEAIEGAKELQRNIEKVFAEGTEWSVPTVSDEIIKAYGAATGNTAPVAADVIKTWYSNLPTDERLAIQDQVVRTAVGNTYGVDYVEAVLPEVGEGPTRTDVGGAPTREDVKVDTGWWDALKGHLSKLGFDTDDPFGSFLNMFNLGTLDEFTAGAQDFDLGFGSIEQQRYMEDLQEYGNYQQNILEEAQMLAERAGDVWKNLSREQQDAWIAEATNNVNEALLRGGAQIPVEPVLDEDAVSDTTKKLEGMLAHQMELATAMTQGGDLAAVLPLAYGQGTAATGIFGASEQILSNIGDRAPWMNQIELLADAAISGDLTKNIDEGNLRNALEPYLRVTAEQTGISIAELMKDVPKFIADEALVGMAQTELIEAIDTIPEEAAKRLDTVGKGVQDKWGNFVAEYGFDWNDLATYAAAQGADTQWNLVDYAVASWDMTRDEAQAYFEANGIDPNIINAALFGDTQMLANAMGGAIPVLTEEWYDFLMEQTNDGANKVLTLTQEAFDKLPDAVKLGYANMGYSFVIGASDAAPMIDSANQMIADRIEDTYQVLTKGGRTDTGTSVDAFWDRFWADLGDDGQINSRFTMIAEDFNAGTQTFQDIVTGQTITIPKTEIQGAAEYAQQLADLEADLARWRTRRENIKEELRDLYDIRDALPTTPQKSPTGLGLETPDGGVITPMEVVPLSIEYEIKIKKDSLDRTRTAINNALGLTTEGTTEVRTMELDFEVPAEVNTAVTSAVTEMVKTGAETGFTQINFDSAAITSSFTIMGQTAGSAFAQGFQNAFNAANVARGGGAQSPDGQIYSDPSPVAATSTQTVTTEFIADTTQFNTAITNANLSLDTFGNRVNNATIGIDTVALYAELYGVEDALDAYDIRPAANATIGIDTVALYEELYGVIGALNAYDTRPAANATVGIVDFASVPLQNIIDKLNSIDNRVVTYTVRNVTENTVQRAAAGGVIDSNLALVGERGPELATFPQGTRIQSSGRTMRMLQQALEPNVDNNEFVSLLDQNSRQATVEMNNSGNTNQVIIQQLVINNDQDGRRFFERMDEWQGRQIQLANRGMIPTDGASTV
jgi:hypothetical protein